MSASAVLDRPARSDALPDGIDWRDTGCEYSPTCLACPLPACRYDAPAPLTPTATSRERAVEARRLHCEGRGINEIAAALGISRRSVFRLLTGGDE